MKEFFVYILTNHSRTLYVGITNDLARRLIEHRGASAYSFTGRYKINQLVWYESFSDVNEAIEWEKKIKGWSRKKKVALIEEKNPHWFDLGDSLLGVKVDSSLRSE
jgi:putative endonuclease